MEIILICKDFLHINDIILNGELLRYTLCHWLLFEALLFLNGRKVLLIIYLQVISPDCRKW